MTKVIKFRQSDYIIIIFSRKNFLIRWFLCGYDIQKDADKYACELSEN